MCFVSVTVKVVARKGRADQESIRTTIVQMQSTWEFRDLLVHVMANAQMQSLSEFEVLKSLIHDGDLGTAITQPNCRWPKEVSYCFKFTRASPPSFYISLGVVCMNSLV